MSAPDISDPLIVSAADAWSLVMYCNPPTPEAEAAVHRVALLCALDVRRKKVAP